MKWKYTLLILALFQAVILTLYFTMTVRHMILIWIIALTASSAILLATGLCYFVGAKWTKDAEAAKRLGTKLLIVNGVDLVLGFTALALYIFEVADFTLLIAGAGLSVVAFASREYLKRYYLSVAK